MSIQWKSMVQRSAKYVLQKKESHTGLKQDDACFIFGWTVPLNNVYIVTMYDSILQTTFTTLLAIHQSSTTQQHTQAAFCSFYCKPHFLPIPCYF